jgi:hypothetical protein
MEINNLNKAKSERILSMYSNTEDILEKGGEGSRGGKVIGHTKSGKPIYDNGNDSKSYRSFTAEDHQDAADIHEKEGKEYNLAQSINHKSAKNILVRTGSKDLNESNKGGSEKYYNKKADEILSHYGNEQKEKLKNMTPENAVDDLKLFAFDLCARNNEYPSQKDLKTIAKTTYDRLNKK